MPDADGGFRSLGRLPGSARPNAELVTGAVLIRRRHLVFHHLADGRESAEEGLTSGLQANSEKSQSVGGGQHRDPTFQPSGLCRATLRLHSARCPSLTLPGKIPRLPAPPRPAAPALPRGRASGRCRGPSAEPGGRPRRPAPRLRPGRVAVQGHPGLPSTHPLTLPSAVLRTHPVKPWALAFFCVKALRQGVSLGSDNSQARLITGTRLLLTCQCARPGMPFGRQPRLRGMRYLAPGRSP